MSLYDDGNPQHLEYRDRWRAISEKIGPMDSPARMALRQLRDCGVMRVTNGTALSRFETLRGAGLAKVIRADMSLVDFTLTERGVEAAAMLPVIG